MKIQISTAIALRDELTDRLANSALATQSGEIELSPVASALIHDAVARDELQADIDEAAQ